MASLNEKVRKHAAVCNELNAQEDANHEGH